MSYPIYYNVEYHLIPNPIINHPLANACVRCTCSRQELVRGYVDDPVHTQPAGQVEVNRSLTSHWEIPTDESPVQQCSNAAMQQSENDGGVTPRRY